MERAKKASERKQMKKPVWLKYTEAEVKEIILSLIKKNPSMTSEKIGLVLRDTYGIPKTRIYGFKISEVLKEADAYKNPDKENLIKKVEKLDAHLAKNKKDKHTHRASIISKARLKKIGDYLASENRQ